jgi:hypothetical protein
MSSPRAINPEMRYSQSMKLPPQSLAGVDEPVADPKKGQNQPHKNQIAHLKFPPILFSILYFNHLGINSASKVHPKASRKRQFFNKISDRWVEGLYFLSFILYNSFWIRAISPDPILPT